MTDNSLAYSTETRVEQRPHRPMPVPTPPQTRPVHTAPGQPQIEIVDLTPELARKWLGTNTRNRKIKKAVVSRYARDIRRGLWQLTGDPIRFDTNRDMIDGQHRCYAVIAADVSIPVVVIRDLHPDAQLVVDTGAKRTVNDALTIRGATSDGRWVGSSIRQYLTYTGGEEPTQSEVVRWVEDHTDEATEAASKAHAVQHAGLRGGAIWGAAWLILTEVDEDATNRFFDHIITGADLPVGSPILHLRARFFEGIPVGSTGVWAIRHNLAWVFKAWNSWRDGRKLQLLRMARSDNYPVPH